MGRKLTAKDLNLNKPDFNNNGTYKPKDRIVCDWMIDSIKIGLANNTISVGDIMPIKSEIAEYLNTSVGTVQNAMRYAEDLGYFISKQRTGTLVQDYTSKEKSFEKMSTKKDVAVKEIKKIISRYELNKAIPTARVLGARIGTSHNTVRLALNVLIEEKYLTRRIINGKSTLVVMREVQNTDNDNLVKGDIENINLVQKLADKIRKILKENYKPGDKITTNTEFAKQFKVSIRTINQITTILAQEGVVLPRRGQYGTIYLGEPTKETEVRKQKSAFMTNPIKNSKYSEQYQWEIIIKKLKDYISKNYEAGDRLPSYKELAKKFNTSANTIRKAVTTLSEQNILFTQRGKGGGTFINNIPENEAESYTWLALNPKYMTKTQN